MLIFLFPNICFADISAVFNCFGGTQDRRVGKFPVFESFCVRLLAIAVSGDPFGAAHVDEEWFEAGVEDVPCFVGMVLCVIVVDGCDLLRGLDEAGVGGDMGDGEDAGLQLKSIDAW